MRIKESQEVQNAAVKASKKALEELRVARACKEQLQQQIDLLDCCAKEVIAVEAQGIKEQERAEAETILFNSPSKGLALNLLLSTQSAFKGLLFKYQETPSAASLVQLPDIPLISASSL